MYARCAQCLSDDIYWSRSGNRWLPRPVRVFVVAGRCHLCGRRSLFRGRLLLGPQLRLRSEGVGVRGGLAGRSGPAAAARRLPRHWRSYGAFLLLSLVGLAAGGFAWYWAAAREAGSGLHRAPPSNAAAAASPQRAGGAAPAKPVEQVTQGETPSVALPAANAADADAFRIWRDAERKREARAKLLSTDGQEVVLMREDGLVVRVPLGPLSDEDRQYVRARIAAKRVPPQHSP